MLVEGFGKGQRILIVCNTFIECKRLMNYFTSEFMRKCVGFDPTWHNASRQHIKAVAAYRDKQSGVGTFFISADHPLMTSSQSSTSFVYNQKIYVYQTFFIFFISGLSWATFETRR